MRKKSGQPAKTKVDREALREKGQFWTPDAIADTMIAYVLQDHPSKLFDPAVGKGAFFYAAKRWMEVAKHNVAFEGMDLDANVVSEAHGALSSNDTISVQDFIQQTPDTKFPAIIANPPYIRHHRLSKDLKVTLKQRTTAILGKSIDGRAGLHIYFLLWSLLLLENKGRLAFILPADTFEGVSAPYLWRWISTQFQIDAVITFDPSASPFPDIDTNPVILLLQKSRPQECIHWVRCLIPNSKELIRFVTENFNRNAVSNELEIHTRSIEEAIRTGLSRSPVEQDDSIYTLGDFVTVMRGIATGANEFFFLTEDDCRNIGIPKELCRPAIGRTKDVSSSRITTESLTNLNQKGRPTLLLNLDGEPLESYPASVRKYLQYGETLGLPNRPLISQRRKWYKMEERQIPPILFAYLGRRNTRFILNEAGVVPLTGFLCVYPHTSNKNFVLKLWELLNHPETLANLPLIGKSYGSGAIKVEPRSLEKLPLPTHLVESMQLAPLQGRLL